MGGPLLGEEASSEAQAVPCPGLTLKMVLSPSWLGPCLVAWRQGMENNFLSPLTHWSPGYWQLFTWATSQGFSRTRRGGWATPRAGWFMAKGSAGERQKGRISRGAVGYSFGRGAGEGSTPGAQPWR